jgi:hypothetical protein
VTDLPLNDHFFHREAGPYACQWTPGAGRALRTTSTSTYGALARPAHARCDYSVATLA